MIADLRDTARFASALTATSTRSIAELIRDGVRANRRPSAPGTARITGYHPGLPAALDDPYPIYRQLLIDGPVHYNQRQDSWIISRYQHVRDALRCDDVLSSADGLSRQRVSLPILIGMDRPDHTRLRRLVAADFSRAALDRWQPAINAVCDELVAAMVRGRHADAVTDLAVPLPTQIIARMLGIPIADLARFQRWSDDSIQAFQLQMSARSLLPFTRSMIATVRLQSYFRAQLHQRRHELGDDLLSRLASSVQHGGLSEAEVFWFAYLLLVAGNETTTNLISGMLLTLATHPDEYQRLRQEPELIASAVDEQLRLHPPVQGFYRTARSDYRVEGCVVPAGARVLILYAAANRDPRRYPDPDTFRLDRGRTDHLAFGSGIHYCLGAYLSKLQAHRVLRQLTQHVTHIELDSRPTWNRNPMLRGLAHLPIQLSSS